MRSSTLRSSVLLASAVVAGSLWSRTAAACGASAGGSSEVFACSLQEHQQDAEDARTQWRVGGAYAFTSTGIRFNGDTRLDEERSVVLATLDYRVARRWTLEVGAGSILGGHLSTPSAQYDFDPGLLASVGSSWRAIDQSGGVPFVVFSGQVSFVDSATHQTGVSAPSIGYQALDVRLGALAGWTLWDTISPYAFSRVFGGPVYWQLQGSSMTGTDVNHYQVGGGLVALVARRVDVFVEGVPLGEQGVSAGAGLIF